MTYVQFKHKFLLHGKGKIKPKLSVGRYGLSATTVGNYAIFGGGYASYADGGYSTVVDAYDEKLTRIVVAPLKNARYQLAATSLGEYALFGGGSGGSSVYNTVDVYDTSLTQLTNKTLNAATYNLGATTVGDYAIFGGGETRTAESNVVTGFNTSLTKTTPTALTYSVYELASASNGTLAFFGGGYTAESVESKLVDVYNSSLVKQTSVELSIARKQLSATFIDGADKYVLFGGGHGDGTLYPNIDVFTQDGTRTSLVGGLSKARKRLTAVTCGTTATNRKALFAGGEQNGTRFDIVDAYDAYLGHTLEKPLSVARYQLASTAIGNYAFVGGGYGTSPTYSDAIDVYTVN